jgi:NADP-dependent aldehyde dehydrogenase
MAPLHGLNFVAAALRKSGRTFAVSSPADGTPLDGKFQLARPIDAEEALTAAEAAAGPFARMTGAERADFLERVAEEILGVGDALIERAAAETALPVARLTGERGRTVGQLRLFAAAARDGSWVDARIDRAQPDRQPLPRPDLRRLKLPLGPVVVFGSSNVPLAFSVAGGDTASALCTGNPVIVKAHRGHPGTSELVAGAIRRAVDACGVPPGVFSMLHGEGSVIGVQLVKDPRVKAVGFTGSRSGGRALVAAAAARPDPIPVFAEMSSCNPVFVLPGAMATRSSSIAEGFRNSMTLGVGQFCTKPGIIVAVEGEDLFRFRTELTAAVAAAAPASMLTAEILREYDAHRETLLGVAGVRVLARADAAADAIRSQAAAVVAETDAATFLAQPRCSEEVFGPCSLLVAVRDLTELRAVARRLDGQLTATIHGTDADLEEGADLFELLAERAGRLIVNGYPTGVEVCHAMQHGGPAPATSDSRFTSVGTAALERFIRPVCLQDMPDRLLPPALQDSNPLALERIVEGVRGRH